MGYMKMLYISNTIVCSWQECTTTNVDREEGSAICESIAVASLQRAALSSLGVIFHVEGGCRLCRRRPLLAQIVPSATACRPFLHWLAHTRLPTYEQLLITVAAGVIPKWW
jgi:hypothetical protein